MRKLVKIILWLVGSVLLLLVLAVGAFALFFDPNDFRSQITAAAKKATGRELTLGEIRLGIYPILGAHVQGVKLANAAGFGDEPMLELAEADVGLRLLPLVLRRELVVGTVAVDGLTARLAKNADGVSNWDDLAKSGEPEPVPEPDPAGDGPALNAIDIGGIDIRNANLSYRDAQTGGDYAIKGLALKTGSIRPGEPFDLDLAFATDIAKPQAKADIKLATRLAYDLAAGRYSASGTTLGVVASTAKEQVDLTLSGNLAADLTAKAATVDGLTLRFKANQGGTSAEGTLSAGAVKADLGTQRATIPALKLAGRATLPDLAAEFTLATNVEADLAAQRFKASALALKADASGSKLPGGRQTLTLDGAASYDGAAGSATLADGRFKAAGLDGTLALDVSGLNGDSPRLRGPIAVKPFDLAALLALLDIKIETTDPAVLKTASFSGRLDAGTSSARISDLVMTLDQSRLAGSAGATSFEPLAAEFALTLDAIDADRYLPPSTTPEPAGPLTPEQKAAANATELPVDALDALSAKGTVDIGKLKLSNLSMRNVQLRVDAPKGQPKAISLGAQLYGGAVSSTTRITPGATPRFAETLKLTGIAAGPLLLDLQGKDTLTGTGNFALDVTTAGKTVGAVKQALNGDLSFSFTNGAVKGFNLGQMLRKADAFLKGQQLSDSAPVQTDFTELGAAATIVNGVLKSDALNAKSPLFRVDGSGQVDLFRETIDYVAKPTIVNTASGQGGKELPDLAGIVIPIKVGGSFDAPKYSLDLKAAFAQKAAQGLKQELVGDKGDKLRERLDTQIEKKLGTQLDANPELKNKLNDGLNKLFGKKKPAPAAVDAAPAPAPEASPAQAPAPTP